MWFLEVKCISDLILCTVLLNPALPAGTQYWHQDRPSCERQLLKVATEFKPSTGAYVFNCIQVHS